jgi:hypothetical protein
MAQVIPATRQLSSTLSTILRDRWTRFLRSSKRPYIGSYGEDVAFSDSLERELNERELHARGY